MLLPPRFHAMAMATFTSNPLCVFVGARRKGVFGFGVGEDKLRRILPFTLCAVGSMCVPASELFTRMHGSIRHTEHWNQNPPKGEGWVAIQHRHSRAEAFAEKNEKGHFLQRPGVDRGIFAS